MGTNHISIEQFNDPKEAPHYHLPEHKGASLEKALVVHNGTVNGHSTVDLIFVDKDGQKHVAMITGALIKSIAAMVR
jgi:hypothetical protein